MIENAVEVRSLFFLDLYYTLNTIHGTRVTDRPCIVDLRRGEFWWNYTGMVKYVTSYFSLPACTLCDLNNFQGFYILLIMK
jgi:hypothetical protein